MFKTFEDVQNVAALGRSDEVLDKFIASYLVGEKTRVLYNETAEPPTDEGFRAWLSEQRQDEQWELPQVSAEEIDGFRRGNYVMFRQGGYPPMEMYLDAIAKEDSEQLEEYKTLCLANKERFPKLEE